jgi:serine/threonine protein kinase
MIRSAGQGRTIENLGPRFGPFFVVVHVARFSADLEQACMGLLDSFKALLRSKVNIRSRFELLREAVSGTMSNFYMARDRQSGEIVGLKVLDREKTAFLESRFQTLNKPSEGEIAMRFTHPRIVKTLEHGITNEDEQYLVMEFLEGPGLNSLIIGRSNLLDGRRLPLLRQGAEALSFVHKTGFIHRDVCPRNFVVSPDGESLKLIDFGLSVPATAPFMAPGNRTGTANYMAPEVVRRRKTSTRLDVFSFGVTAYELCTFALPWPKGQGKEAMSHGVEEPTPMTQYRPRINPRLAEAITACLAADPAQRPASLDEFLKLIKGIKHEDV